MNFDLPIPWTEAMEDLAALDLLPTKLSSLEIREQWGRDLRERSLFSARTAKAGILADYRDRMEELMGGKTNIATARAEMQDMYDGIGYTPDRAGIQNLASDARIDLVLKTNTAQVAAAADAERANGEDERYWFPAFELVRVESREVPRDWPDRWEQVGGEFFDGRMIALKDDPIWRALGSSANFDDALDTEYEPYAFNSGYGREEVARRECLALGLIDGNETPDKTPVELNEGLSASVKGLNRDDLKAVSAGLKTEADGLKLKLKASGYNLATGRYE